MYTHYKLMAWFVAWKDIGFLSVVIDNGSELLIDCLAPCWML
jgi:hypothetical protein